MNTLHAVLGGGIQAYAVKPLLKIASLFVLSAYLASCGGGSGGSSEIGGGMPGTGPGAGTGATTDPAALFGLAGFSLCGQEGGTIDLKVKTHLAYGASGAFVYLFNQLGTVKLDNTTFGSDPIFGTGKSVYCKVVVEGADAGVFATAVGKIKQHLQGSITLTAAEINQQAGLMASSMLTVIDSEAGLADALAILDLYEKKEGVLFIAAKTKGGFQNRPGSADGFELARAVFALQQGIFDHAFTPTTFAKYKQLLSSKKFNTSDFYPGKVKVAADASKTYTARINASMPKYVGLRSAWSTMPALRPTGYYLAAGDVATVTVPASMVGKGFTIRVGAHKQDKNGSNPVRRFFRISKTYPITSASTEVANPFGGGIYINTPYLADAGLVDVQIKNAVPAPFFSATTHNKTTLADWLATQRNNPAPWADFESDKFMMQVPTSFIYNYADPVALMQDWDNRLDTVSRLTGRPLVRNNTILYIQPDTDIMFSGYGIGYPAINNAYDPNAATDGNNKSWFLTPGVNSFWDTEFHELGHAELFGNFPGEGEAAVNVLAAAVYNKNYGLNIDTAFGKSFFNQPHITREQAALNWMVTPNFRDGKAMDISNTTKDEVRYQHRGWAKYVEIADLFTWGALERFNAEENRVADLAVPPASDGLSGVDSRIFRMSKEAGVDLTPLIHFWGVQPVDAVKLKAQMTAANLKPSALIYDRLVKYQSIIPMDNAAFKTHAAVFLNKPASAITAGESPDYAEGWYFVWLPKYAQAEGQAAQAAMTAILTKYFPSGRPQ
jgi:Peptidase M60, enhancin and enhancin-like/N-terminal domain of M60-like peptidases